MEPLFEGLTESEIEYLQYLRERGYFDGFEMFCNLDTSSDYRVKKLQDNGYINLRSPGPRTGSLSVDITGKGIAAIVDYDRYQNQIKPMNVQIKAITEMSESLKAQTEIVEKEAHASIKMAKSAETIAEMSRQSANKADVKGWIAVIISALAFLLELISRLGLF